MNFLLIIGRLCFALIFIMSGYMHFLSSTIQYAAVDGVPYANILVPLSGIIACVGGLSVLFGYKARIGAWLLILFLVPITYQMHDFWTFVNPEEIAMQKANFLKNLSLIGASLIVAYFGSGPWSIDKDTTVCCKVDKKEPTA